MMRNLSGSALSNADVVSEDLCELQACLSKEEQLQDHSNESQRLLLKLQQLKPRATSSVQARLTSRKFACQYPHSRMQEKFPRQGHDERELAYVRFDASLQELPYALHARSSMFGEEPKRSPNPE